MTDTTICISSEPEIKCYVGHQIRDDGTVKGRPEKVRTGESVYCICAHHVEQNCTLYLQYCHDSNEHCNCELFRTHSIRIDLLPLHSNYNKKVMEGFADV